jgi:hypothetical protein
MNLFSFKNGQQTIHSDTPTYYNRTVNLKITK